MDNLVYYFPFLFLLFLIINSFFTYKYYKIITLPDETYFQEADNELKSGLLRYKPDIIKYKESILLIHGYANNRYCFDLSEKISLARFFKSKGFDTWLLELPGRGFSGNISIFNNKKLNRTPQDHLTDIINSIKKIKSINNNKINLVGYGLGGLLAIDIGIKHSQNINSISAISTPFDLHYLKNRISWIISLEKFLYLFQQIPYLLFSFFIAPYIGFYYPEIIRTFVNPYNLDPNLIRQIFINTFSNELKSVNLISWINNYENKIEFNKLKIPCSLITGSWDNIAPPEVITKTFNKLEIQDKKMIVIGRSYGSKVNYGHIDILLSKESINDVYPEIFNWIKQVSNNFKTDEINSLNEIITCKI